MIITNYNYYLQPKLYTQKINKPNYTQSAPTQTKLTPFAQATFNPFIHFHPSFGLEKFDTKEVLKKQDESGEYEINLSDISDEIPTGFENIFSDKTANVVGAGNIYTSFLGLGKIINFYYDKNNEINIFDPKLIDEKEPSNKILIGYHFLKAIKDICKGSAFIISPHKFHSAQLEELAQKEILDGVYTDKPMCINKRELNNIDNIVTKTNTPLYFGDFFFFSQIPALRLMGVPMPYKDAITVQFDKTKDKKFTNSIKTATPLYKEDQIKKVTCKTIEKCTDDFLKRKWLQEKENGGGVILDLQVHISNLLNLMGLELTKINSITAEKFENGSFRPVTKTEAEDRAVIKGKLNDKIPVYMETAQFMNERDNSIIFEMKDGKKLKIYTDVFDKKVELIDRNGKVQARAYTIAMPYSLMFHHVQKSFEDKKANRTPMFYDIQRKTMKQLFTMQELIDEQSKD